LLKGYFILKKITLTPLFLNKTVWVLTINFVDIKIYNNNGGPDYFKALSFNKSKEF